MKHVVPLILLSIALARADFGDDRYVERPDSLLRIVEAAAKTKGLEGAIDPNEGRPMTFYLKETRYIGPIKAPFGTVHVAQLFYIRSAPKGTKLPPRGHTYVVFLDEHFVVRTMWEMDDPNQPKLSINDNKLWADAEAVLDYQKRPQSGEIVVDGKVFTMPQWAKEQ